MPLIEISGRGWQSSGNHPTLAQCGNEGVVFYRLRCHDVKRARDRTLTDISWSGIHRQTYQTKENVRSYVSITFLTIGLPSLTTARSILATLWSILLACSSRSFEFTTNVPSAKTIAARTCNIVQWASGICTFLTNQRRENCSLATIWTNEDRRNCSLKNIEPMRIEGITNHH